MGEQGDESLDMGSRTWNRVMESAVKTGYREGIDEGSQEVLQSDFDRGYEDGFKMSFILGKYKALAAHSLKANKSPPEIERILEATRRGECYICKLEASGQINNLDTTEVIEEHKDHVLGIIKKLDDYFSPLTQEKQPEMNNLKLN